MIRHKLEVRKLPDQDCWRDLVRLPREFRKDVTGEHIHRGSICQLTIKGRSKLLTVRGWDEGGDIIMLDQNTRQFFDVHAGGVYEIHLRRGGWLAHLRWAWNAADPGYRIPFQISMVSLSLGLVGLLLGILSMVK